MKKQEFAQNHQKWYIYVSVILFHMVENHEKLLIASKRARSGDFPCTMTSTWKSTQKKLELDQSWGKSREIYNILERIILWTEASEAQCNATETISSLSIVNLQKWVRNGLGAVRMCFHTSKHCIFKMWRWVMFLVKYVHMEASQYHPGHILKLWHRAATTQNV